MRDQHAVGGSDRALPRLRLHPWMDGRRRFGRPGRGHLWRLSSRAAAVPRAHGADQRVGRPPVLGLLASGAKRRGLGLGPEPTQGREEERLCREYRALDPGPGLAGRGADCCGVPREAQGRHASGTAGESVCSGWRCGGRGTAGRMPSSSSSPRPSWLGIGRPSGATGPPSRERRAGRDWTRRFAGSSSGWRARIRPGVRPASTASS